MITRTINPFKVALLLSLSSVVLLHELLSVLNIITLHQLDWVRYLTWKANSVDFFDLLDVIYFFVHGGGFISYAGSVGYYGAFTINLLLIWYMYSQIHKVNIIELMIFSSMIPVFILFSNGPNKEIPLIFLTYLYGLGLTKNQNITRYLSNLTILLAIFIIRPVYALILSCMMLLNFFGKRSVVIILLLALLKDDLINMLRYVSFLTPIMKHYDSTISISVITAGNIVPTYKTILINLTYNLKHINDGVLFVFVSISSSLSFIYMLSRIRQIRNLLPLVFLCCVLLISATGFPHARYLVPLYGILFAYHLDMRRGAL